MMSLLTQVTESPGAMVSDAGSKLVASIVTVCMTGLAFFCVAPAPALPISSTRAVRRSFLATRSSVPGLAERRLNLLGMLEMRNERRAHLDQQRLQVGVLGAGDQRLVDRFEHLGVVRDLMVHVGLVEVG